MQIILLKLLNETIYQEKLTIFNGNETKLSIAVSLMNKPKYLILDEPTNGMDPDGSIDVLKTIQSLVQQLEMKILISSHKLEDIELICDRAVFLEMVSSFKM